MNEWKKKILEKTQDTLYRHLDDLNRDVDGNDGHIDDHEILDEIKDSRKGIHLAEELLRDGGNGDPAKAGSASMVR